MISLEPQPLATSSDIAEIQKLLEFFKEKGLPALKDEDKHETWYQDWIDYQKKHKIYAGLLSLKKYSQYGFGFDLLKLMRFMQTMASLSAAHGYSLQVSFLGIFPLYRSQNEELVKEAVRTLEEGGLFAFGVSEQAHGSDLYSNEFIVKEVSSDQYVGSGKKYYIGNSNCARMISVLGRTQNQTPNKEDFIFFALRPDQVKNGIAAKKISTMGVRAAFVGEFTVKEHSFSSRDIASQGKSAWDAIFGTVNLGKFFLGFGSIGMCERAFFEALSHVQKRVLFGKSVLDFPHIRSAMTECYARLYGMKLFAYRALDYLQHAGPDDRRYLLYNSVQKARVGTEGAKVMQLLSECVNARGFESETFFEMALRDIQMIPGLEGSTHINYGIMVQFMKSYFFSSQEYAELPSLLAKAHEPTPENEYLFRAPSGGIKSVKFQQYLHAYRPLMDVENIKFFVKQLKAIKVFLLAFAAKSSHFEEAETMMRLGRVFSCVAYGQLIAENAQLQKTSPADLEVIFHFVIEDLSQSILRLNSLASLNMLERSLLGRAMISPRTEDEAFRNMEKRFS